MVRFISADNSYGKAAREPGKVLLEHGTNNTCSIGCCPTGSTGDHASLGSGSRGNGDGSLYGVWISFRWHGGAEMNPLGVAFLVLLGVALIIGFIVLTDRGLKWKDRP